MQFRKCEMRYLQFEGDTDFRPVLRMFLIHLV